MRLRRPGGRLVVRAAQVALGLLSCAAFAADDPWRGWSAVKRFSGEATIQYRSWIDRDDGFTRETSRGEDRATIRFVLERDPGGDGHDTAWRPVSIEVAGEHRLTRSTASQTGRLEYAERSDFDLALPPSAYLRLTLIHETGDWELLLPGNFGQSVPLEVERSEWRLGEDEVTESRTEKLSSFATLNFRGRAPRELGVLTQSHSQHYEDPAEEERGGGHSETGRVMLWPEYDDFELRVRIENYDRWRPFGSIQAPKQPGNHLVARATLVPKRPGAEMPEVRGFRFALAGTSREPGVCMNFPLHAKDSDPDLRLAATAATPGAVGAEGQTLEIERSLRDASGRPYAEGRIDSYDYGGRAELHVTVELDDGRVIAGRLEGAAGPGGASIRIPKRTKSQWIADAWHEEHGTQGLGDYDDSENEPVHDGHKGDGFTYYQEYRGFAENGEWIYGSPRKRDMFIYLDPHVDRTYQNALFIGDKFQGGIELFRQLTGIAVHEKLRPEEWDWKPGGRVMNANRREGPHIVNQYGVSMTYKIDDDAETTFDKGTTKGRLRKTQMIQVGILELEMDLERWRATVPLADRLRARDRAIAHELLHTIGVEHHGEGAMIKDFRLAPPGYPGNRTDKPVFIESTGAGPRIVRIVDERTGQDLLETAEEQENIRRFLAVDRKAQAISPELREGELSRAIMWNRTLIIGTLRDQHSGDDQCVMRYTYAHIYPALGRNDLYYLVPPDSEPAGLQLCRTPTGTGVNLLGRKPQPRYGQCAEGRGDCLHQICVSDRYH